MTPSITITFAVKWLGTKEISNTRLEKDEFDGINNGKQRRLQRENYIRKTQPDSFWGATYMGSRSGTTGPAVCMFASASAAVTMWSTSLHLES